MRAARYVTHKPSPARPTIDIPDAQALALGRRQALDAQQRAFRAATPPDRVKRN